MAGESAIAQLPAQGDIVAHFQNVVSDDGAKWLDVKNDNDILVNGYSGNFASAKYGKLTTPVAISTDWSIEVNGFVVDGAYSAVALAGEFGGSDYIRLSPEIAVVSDGTGFVFNSLIVSPDVKNDLLIVRDATGITCTLNGVSERVEKTPGTFHIGLLYRRDGGDIWKGVVPSFKLSQSGVLTNHWICESSPTTLQSKVFDDVGGNDADLLSAPVAAFFTAKIEGSDLFKRGFELSSGDYIPAGAASTLTNQPVQFDGDYCLFYAPITTPFYDAAVVAGIENDLYLAGDINTPIGLSADDWLAIMVNPFFFGADKNILVVYDSVQSGSTLDQINNYLGI